MTNVEPGPHVPWTPQSGGVRWQPAPTSGVTPRADQPGPRHRAYDSSPSMPPSPPPAGLPRPRAPHPGDHLPPAPRRPPWGWIVGGVVIAVVLLVAVLALVVVTQTSRMTTAQGSVTIGGTGTLRSGAGCQMTSAQGRPISIFGSSGDLVGSTSLTGTDGVATNQWSTSPMGYADACVFRFTLADVAATDSFYRVTTGSDISNSVGFSRQQLQTSGANISVRY